MLLADDAALMDQTWLARVSPFDIYYGQMARLTLPLTREVGDTSATAMARFDKQGVRVWQRYGDIYI